MHFQIKTKSITASPRYWHNRTSQISKPVDKLVMSGIGTGGVELSCFPDLGGIRGGKHKEYPVKISTETGKSHFQRIQKYKVPTVLLGQMPEEVAGYQR